MKVTNLLFVLGLSVLGFSSLALAEDKIDLDLYQQSINSQSASFLISYGGRHDFNESQVLCISKDANNWDYNFPENMRIGEYPNRVEFLENRLVHAHCQFSTRFESNGPVSNVKLSTSDGQVVDGELTVFAEATSGVSRIRPLQMQVSDAETLCNARAIEKMQKLIQQKGNCQ